MFAFLKTYIKKGFKIANKIFLVLAVYFIVFGLFAYFINRDKPKATVDPIKRNRDEIYKVIKDPELNKTKEGKQVILLYRATMCGLLGEACTDNPQDGNINFDNSLIGKGVNLLMFPYFNPPASGVYWAQQSLQRAGFIPKTYAVEGIGFASIKPLADVWTGIRNVAYVFLVIVLITFGFLIMFRVKINPQTVISIENTIPRIVVSLIFITFSFAIAGFLIDLMYVFIVLIIFILGQAGGLDINSLQARYIQARPSDIFSSLAKFSFINLFWTFPNAMLNLLGPIAVIKNIIGALIGYFFIYLKLAQKFGWVEKVVRVEAGAEAKPSIFGFSLGGVSAALHGFVNGIVQGGIYRLLIPVAAAIGIFIIIPFLLGVIFFISIVFIFFRILILLLSAYIKIILLIITAPVYLLRELFPGKAALPSWFKSLINELLTFPLVITVFIFALIIFNLGGSSSGEFIRLPFLYGIDPGNFSIVIAMWFLFAAPNLVQTVKKAILPKPLDLGVSPSVFFTGITGATKGVMGSMSQFSGLFYAQHGINMVRDWLANRGKPKPPKGGSGSSPASGQYTI